ncbi:MAG: hypothetical protein CL943_03560, partial [Candidatus Diapherotrites archaeon]|nr:hypothetical protein [Candidatus Diapherotrites archaeon]
MDLKDIYYSWEDKWYKFLDKVDEKVPIYKIIEPVDKIVPSFALILILVVIALLGIGLTLLSLTSGSVFSVEVLYEDGNPVENATVKAFLEGEEVFSDVTDASGKTGFSGSLPPGSEVELRISREGYEDLVETLTLTNAVTEQKSYLLEIALREVTILLKDEFNQPIREPVTLYFSCRNPNVQAPSSLT